MNDILIISTTNRPGSYSAFIANNLQQILNSHNIKTEVISLENLNDTLFLSQNMYDKQGTHPGLKDIQESILIPAKNWIWVVPEYNGSIPGVLKLWIDMCSLYRSKETFHHKKMGLIGVSTGRAGNLRGLDHLTGILHHMNAHVMPSVQPISSVHLYVNEKGEASNELLEVLHQFAARYQAYIGG